MKRVLLTALLFAMFCGCVNRREYVLNGIILPAVSSQQSINSADELRLALENRWSLDRIEEFTRHKRPADTRGIQGLKPNKEDWNGQLHIGQAMFTQIHFHAFVEEEKPVWFMLTTQRRQNSWLLEVGEIDDLYHHGFIDFGK